MERITRTLADTLALLLGLNPRRRALAVFLAAGGLVAMNLFASALFALLGPRADRSALQIWVGLLSLPLVFVLFIVAMRQTLRRLYAKELKVIEATAQPAGRVGLVVFLSTFSTFTNKLPEHLQLERWQGDDLVTALAQEPPEWGRIRRHVIASNMQTPLEAVRYHYDEGTLRHVWVVCTTDTQDAEDNVRAGSQGLAEAFAQVVRHEFPENCPKIHDHHNNGRLLTPAYNVEETFAVVDYIYREEAPRYSLRPQDIISDITSGPVTMTAGMTLACALYERPLQYTAAQQEPVHGKAVDVPKPYAINVDDEALRRLVLRHMADVEAPPQAQAPA